MIAYTEDQLVADTEETRSLGQRVSHIERVVDGVRGDLTSVKTDLASIAGQLGPLAATQARIESRLNEPAPATNWVGIGGLILSAMTFFGLLFGFAFATQQAQIVETKAHIQKDRDQLLANSTAITALQTQTAENDSDLKTGLEWMTQHNSDFHELKGRMDARHEIWMDDRNKVWSQIELGQESRRRVGELEGKLQ